MHRKEHDFLYPVCVFSVMHTELRPDPKLWDDRGRYPAMED